MTESGLSLADGLDLAGLTYPELWWRYLSLGGLATVTELREHIADEDHASAYEHNLIAQALNDHFIDHDEDHPVAYRTLYKRAHRA